MKKMKYTSGIMVFFLLLSCYSNKSFQEQIIAMPDKVNSVIIEYHYNAGMYPEGQDIYLSKDSSYFYSWNNEHRTKTYFNSSTDELNQLYRIFHSNDFNRINEVEEKEVYDRGGSVITIYFNDKFIEKKNSGSTFLYGNNGEKFKKIESAILDFVEAKIKDSYVPVKIHLDGSVETSKYHFFLSVNQKTLINSIDSTLITAEIGINLLPGVHEFDLRYYSKDSLDYNNYPAMVKRDLFNVNISNETNQINVSNSNNQFTLDQK